MVGARAAIRYAKALLSTANDQNSADAVNNDMVLIANTIADNKDLSDMLLSPVFSPSIKKSCLTEIFKDTNPLTDSLIDTLITNKRIDIIDIVALKFNELYDNSKGIEIATVTTAIALTDDLKAKVLTKAKELTGKEVTVENIIDENILGGFILRIGDLQYNASISNQLSKLKREFTLN